jgi:AraC family transcriptional regulator
VLDRPIQLSVEGIDRDPTLRSLAERLVSQLEMWVSAVGGGTRMPTGPSATGADLQARLDEVAPRFREAVLTPVQEGRPTRPSSTRFATRRRPSPSAAYSRTS